MFEVSDEVYCVLGTADEYVWIVRVIPTKQSMQMQLHATDSDLPAETQDSIIAGVSLLLAAIIRDFWVVEERESAFLGRQVHKPRTGSKPADADIRTVYLPRVRYINRPDIERCATELAHHERRAHWVSAHLRLAEHASEQQYLLAEHYGFHIPSGYTFVRQHERGGKKREVIYRSRSALNLLYTLSTDQLAGSRRSDFDLVNWVIQCKCYAPTHKVNPSKIREMKGVLSDYPHGTRGMIVTTSSFTSGALEEAKAAEIRLVDGAEFVGLVESAR
ncbi:MAG: restriction endonuclease [Methanomicrobiales archaeon]|nr:restriction endonuclease [Methanomicrobiales archaeon]